MDAWDLDDDFDDVDLSGLSPEGRARVERRRQRAAELDKQIAKDEKPLRRDLAKLGFDLDFDGLVAHRAPFPDDVVAVLLKHLVKVHLPSSKEMILRGLMGAARPFDGTPLQTVFESTADSEVVRWLILNLIAGHRVHSIDDWTQQLLASPRGKELERLGYFKKRPGSSQKAAKPGRKVRRPRQAAETSTSMDRSAFRPLLKRLDSQLDVTAGGERLGSLAPQITKLKVAASFEAELSVRGKNGHSPVFFDVSREDETTLQLSFQGPRSIIRKIDGILCDFLEGLDQAQESRAGGH